MKLDVASDATAYAFAIGRLMKVEICLLGQLQRNLRNS